MSGIEHIACNHPLVASIVTVARGATRYGQLLLFKTGADMVTIFECLGCGEDSILEKLPAKCPHCGHGNGLLRDTTETATPPIPPRRSDENAAGE
jgi:hypothetical protein